MDKLPESLLMLERAFNSDFSSAFIATRLARRYESQGDPERAITILQKSLSNDPTNKHLNFSMAKMLIKPGSDSDLIKRYLVRSCAVGDTNHQARFVSANFFFLNGEEEHATQLYKELKESSGPLSRKRHIRSIFHEADGHPGRFFGRVEKVMQLYGFVSCSKFNSWIHIRDDNTSGLSLAHLEIGNEVEFELGFCYLGPEAVNLSLSTMQ